ncbi:hypothetical protein GT585_06475 [Enterococcus avium]|uniref:hypothetical protein n=1 Tax=Enterococcus avium TaxID=33945 RepID=UPI00136A3DAD|nr:hypothetical protein [Enterococcus avium]MZJ57098.1 hypothetical protein [Enterococcus avium]MZJ77620.1 hypothetical protein [Enterococcus avium]MZJ81879.1 hypothetical protein [Enterococcus avium]MZJ88139.1 hypothetical protein [Enterococcus avium]
MKPAIIGGSICHAFNPDSSLSNFLLDFLFAGLIASVTGSLFSVVFVVVNDSHD